MDRAVNVPPSPLPAQVEVSAGPCRIRVEEDLGRFAVFAAEPIARAEVVLGVVGREVARPERHSIQTGWQTHLVGPDMLPPDMAVAEYGWRFLNHSCEPNAYLKGDTLVALRELPEGAEITFDYNTTEWDLANPFACACGSAVCVGTVRGFAHLDGAARQRLYPYLAEYLKGPTPG